MPPERQEVHRLGAAAHEEMARLADRLREEEDFDTCLSGPVEGSASGGRTGAP
jgi:hypothetical protein